jgi:hypothetical protein
MLVLFRIASTVTFIWLLLQLRGGGSTAESEVANAGWLAAAVIAGIATACTWAPWAGEWVASPMTDLLTDGTVIADRNWIMRGAHYAVRRRWRRLALALCFVEGVRYPDLPGAFVIGLRQCLPGSWLERLFAKRVFLFNNVLHCVYAADILKLRHDHDPGRHPSIEVNLALLSTEPSNRPEAPRIPLPSAPPPEPPPRNHRIQLFRGAGLKIVNREEIPEEPS